MVSYWDLVTLDHNPFNYWAVIVMFSLFNKVLVYIHLGNHTVCVHFFLQIRFEVTVFPSLTLIIIIVHNYFQLKVMVELNKKDHFVTLIEISMCLIVICGPSLFFLGLFFQPGRQYPWFGFTSTRGGAS